MDQHAGAIRTKEMVQALSNGLPTSTCHLFGCEQVADRARHSAPHDPGRADLHRDGHGEGCRAVRQQQQPRRPGFAGLTPPPAAVVIALGRRAFRAVPAADGYGHRPRRAELALPRDDHRRHRDFPRGAPATGLASDKTRVLHGNRWIPAWTQVMNSRLYLSEESNFFRIGRKINDLLWTNLRFINRHLKIYHAAVNLFEISDSL